MHAREQLPGERRAAARAGESRQAPGSARNGDLRGERETNEHGSDGTASAVSPVRGNGRLIPSSGDERRGTAAYRLLHRRPCGAAVKGTAARASRGKGKTMSEIYDAGCTDASNALWGTGTRNDGGRARLRARAGVLMTIVALTLAFGATTAAAKPRPKGTEPAPVQATVSADDGLVADATASVSYSDVSYSDVSYSAAVSYDG